MSVSQSRRAFLTGSSPASSVLRQPPWTGDDYTDLCSRCGDCLKVCPEQVLVAGDGGFPELVFRGDGCTFCEQCVNACPEPVFDLTRVAFSWRAAIGDRCLPLHGIHCQSCQDACEPRAIGFRPRLGGPPEPSVATEVCTGCGACVALCPEDAITLDEPSPTGGGTYA